MAENDKPSESSPEYSLYRSLFPIWVPASALHTLTKQFYKNAKDSQPWRFSLSTVGSVFDSFIKSGSEEDLKFDKYTAWFGVVFTHDLLTYRAHTKTMYFRENNEKWSELVIKLPNNGFLYKTTQMMETIENNLEHHNSNTYSTLSGKECNDPFLPIWRFAASLFDDREWIVRVFYSFVEDRIDIKIRHLGKRKSLEITFEAGYPIQPFTDMWKPLF